MGGLKGQDLRNRLVLPRTELHTAGLQAKRFNDPASSCWPAGAKDQQSSIMTRSLTGVAPPCHSGAAGARVNGSKTHNLHRFIQ